MHANKEDRSLTSLISDLTQETYTLVRKEVTLAKAEMAEKVAQLGAGIASLAVDGAVAFAGMLVILWAIVGPSKRERFGQALSSAGAAASNTGHRIGGTARGVADRISSTAHDVSDRVSGVAANVRQRAGRVRETARDQYGRARGGAKYLAHEQPLVLAALGVALGAAVAALLPSNAPRR